jgi:transposase-like protein
MTKTGYFKRHRFPVFVVRCAILMHLAIPSRFVVVLLYLLFRVRISHKTVCEWTKKFSAQFSVPAYRCRSGILICHSDEKFVKVNGEWNYWWSLKDSFGEVIHSIITACRDFASAKRLFKEAHALIGRDVDLLIRDGLPSYDRAIKFLGRKCKSIVAGIQGKGFLHKNQFYWITNNPSESLNSEIDCYLGKFQYHFQNADSANRFAHSFKLQKYLKKCYAEKKLSEATSLLDKMTCEVPCSRD